MATYIIRAGYGGPVKIGKARHVASRVACLQTAHYEELRVIRIIKGDVEIEFHRHFRAARIRGEWFHFDPEMLTYEPPVDELLEQYRAALSAVDPEPVAEVRL